MSNSTDQIIKTFADTFITWFNNDILPVCSVIFDLLVIVVGVSLNVLLIVTFRRRRLFLEPSTHFIFALCLIDFLAYGLLLVPSVVAAIAGDWLLSHPACEFHGAIKDVLMLAQFYILVVLGIERAMKLVGSAEKYYDKIFEKPLVVRVTIGAVSGLSLIIGFIPVTGAGHIGYDFYHHGCRLDYVDGMAFMIVHFTLTVCVSFIGFMVCYILIFNERRKSIIRNRLDSPKKVNVSGDRKSDVSMGTVDTLPPIEEQDDNVFENQNSDTQQIVAAPESSKVRSRHARPRSRPRSSGRPSLVFEVFSDDEENPAFHLAITYLALWGAILVCYLPYFIASFYDTFTEDRLWGGFYTVTLLVVHASFVAKPVIYLGHNRHYQEVTKQTVPLALRNRARSVRNSVTSVQGRIEDFLFKSAANKRFTATIAAHKAILVWKKKTKKNQGSLKLTPSEANSSGKAPVIPKSILMTSNETSSPETSTQLGPDTSDTQTAGSDHLLPGRNSSLVTPSAIEVAPASSYIERERERLTAMHGPTRTLPSPEHHMQVTSLHVTPTEGDEGIPGVVGENDRKSPIQSQPW